jgi:hypothetical protein
VKTSRAIRTEVADLLGYLIENDVALFANPVVEDGGRVGWPRRSDAPRFLDNRGVPTISDYRWWLLNEAYSAVLHDGALVQITYEFDGRALARHRLAYVPCPFEIPDEDLRSEPLVDLFDVYAGGSTSSVMLGGPVRFDYDAARGAPQHPAAHLTVNSVHCRVPCAAPMRLGVFVDFVFRHFYPEIWEQHGYLGTLAKDAFGPGTITEEEGSRVHVMWR